MPISLNDITDLQYLLTKQPEAILSRARKKPSNIKNAAYWIDLIESGKITYPQLAETIISLYSVFTVMSVRQIATFLFAPYTDEVYQIVLKTIAEMYATFMLEPVRVNRINQVNPLMPAPSLFFTLGVGGIPVIKSMFPGKASAEQWSESKILAVSFRGLHDAIVTQLLITAFYEGKFINNYTQGFDLSVHSEYDFTFPIETGVGKHYNLRPDGAMAYALPEDITIEGETFDNVFVMLEYDNGTEPITTLLKKVYYYSRAHKQGLISSDGLYSIAFVFNDTKRAEKFRRDVSKLTPISLAELGRMRIWVNSIDDIISTGGFLSSEWYEILPERLRLKKSLIINARKERDEEERQRKLQESREIIWYQRGTPDWVKQIAEIPREKDNWVNIYDSLSALPHVYFETELKMLDSTHERIYGKPMLSSDDHEELKIIFGNLDKIYKSVH